jgi:phosphate acetyltransferase
MVTDVMAALREKARVSPQRIVFPEANEESILRAARSLLDEGIAKPILLGEPSKIGRLAQDFGVSLSGVQIVDTVDEAARYQLAEDYHASFADISVKGAERRLRSPLNAGACLVALERADALVAGQQHATQDVILAAMTFIGMQRGISTPSSMMLMRVPGYGGPEGELIVFADCAVAVAPDSAELADIAITTARTTQALLDWEPRIAMLSFSTKGSGDHESVQRVVEALRMVRQREPRLLVDGELQLDAAIVPAVAARKVPGGSAVAGRANILIFPDLNAGNIAYKAVQRLAGADAFGPLLQGFAKAASDLSRGSSVADVVGAATLAAVHALGMKRLG